MIVVALLSSKIQPTIEAQKSELNNASSLAHEAFCAIDTVKCFNGQSSRFQQYAASISQAGCYYMRQAHLNSVRIGCARLMMFGIFIQGFWYGSSLVGSGAASAGNVMRTFWACIVAIQSIEQLLPRLFELEKGKAAASSLKVILDRPNPDYRLSGCMETLPPWDCYGDIEVKSVGSCNMPSLYMLIGFQVSFAYPSQPNRLVLQCANFIFPAGNTTFIIGRSGSGKSTLADLLLRFYTPISGEILIDGKPIHMFDVGWIRNNITLVQQESILFNETILQNISLGRQTTTDARPEQIKTCIEMANLRDLADSMPEGFDTVVGVGGNLLSGGQRQRVAIARARLRDTPILILDECTSALDSKNQTAVMKSIREWRRGKTTIIITHDITQILEDDFAYILDNGKVIHSGRKPRLGKMRVTSYCRPPSSVKSVIETEIDEKEPLAFLRKWEHPLYVPVSKYNLQSTPPPLNLHLPGDDRNFAHLLSDHSVGENQVLKSFDLSYPQEAVTSRLHISVTLNDTSFMSENGPSFANVGSDLNSINKPLPSIQLPYRNDSHYLSGYWSRSKMKLGARFGFSDLRLATLNPSRTRKSQNRRPNRPASMSSPRSLYQIMFTIFPHLTLTQHFYLILGLLCSLVHSSATPVFAFLFSRLLETFYIAESRSQAARRWSLAVLGVAIGDAAAAYWMHYLLEYCGQAWTDSVRRAAMVRILDQPRSWFELDENMSHLLVLYLDQNAEEMRKIIGKFAAFVLVATSIILITFSWSFTISWKLTIVGLACGPFIFAITRGFEIVSGKWERRSNDICESTISIFSETFLDIRTVKALTLESYFDEKHFKALKKGMEICFKRAAFTGFFFGLTESAVIFVTGKLPRMPEILSDTPVIALLFYYGAVLESSLEVTTNDVVTVFSMLLISMGYVNVVLTWSKSTALRHSRGQLQASVNYPSSP